MTITGTLERVDIGMGAWVIRRDDGTRVQVIGPVDDGLAGQRVQVSGTAVNEHSTSMLDVTATVRVASSPNAV